VYPENAAINGEQRARAVEIRRLERAQIAQAYPMVRELLRDLTPEAWQAFAAKIMDHSDAEAGRTGVIVAESDDGHIRGLFVFRVEDDLDQGTTLVVQHFITPGLGRRTVAEALYSEIREITQRFTCDAIHVEVPPETSWELNFFQSQGHRVVNWLLSHSATPNIG
jgi:hypothetical protein